MSPSGPGCDLKVAVVKEAGFFIFKNSLVPLSSAELLLGVPRAPNLSSPFLLKKGRELGFKSWRREEPRKTWGGNP